MQLKPSKELLAFLLASILGIFLITILNGLTALTIHKNTFTLFCTVPFALHYTLEFHRGLIDTSIASIERESTILFRRVHSNKYSFCSGSTKKQKMDPIRYPQLSVKWNRWVFMTMWFWCHSKLPLFQCSLCWQNYYAVILKGVIVSVYKVNTDIQMKILVLLTVVWNG